MLTERLSSICSLGICLGFKRQSDSVEHKACQKFFWRPSSQRGRRVVFRQTPRVSFVLRWGWSWSRRWFREDYRSRGCNSLPFLNCNRLVGFNIRDSVLLSAGPNDFQSQSSTFFRLTKSERKRQFALGTIAGAGLHHPKELHTFRSLQCNSSANPIAV